MSESTKNVFENVERWRVRGTYDEEALCDFTIGKIEWLRGR